MKLSEVLERNILGLIIDGNYYPQEKVTFSPEELDIELDVVTVCEPLGVRTKLAQGVIDGHKFLARIV